MSGAASTAEALGRTLSLLEAHLVSVDGDLVATADRLERATTRLLRAHGGAAARVAESAPARPCLAPVPARAAPAPIRPAPARQTAASRLPRRRARGVLRPVAVATLALAGTLVLTDAVLTWVWKEPVSAFRQQRAQDRLGADLNRLERRVAFAAAPATAGAGAGAAERRRARARATARRVRIARVLRRAHAGTPLGRLEIPALGVRQVVVQGTGAEQLAAGLGHYRDTALPALDGTIGIAGHRTTFGAPLRHVDRLRVGNRIRLRTPYGMYVFRVIGKRIVAPKDAWVLRRGGGEPRLVLTACHPPFSAAQRLVVTARLVHAPGRA